MSFLKKPLVIIGTLLLLVVATGAVLFQQGMLPFADSLSGEALADAGVDSTAAEIEDNSEDEGPEVMPIPVELARVSARGISAYYRAASVVEADRLVDLTCRTTGRIRTIKVEEGDWVEAEQVLAELENDREEIQLRKAELTLADKTRLLERNKEMLAEELISRQEYDDVESGWRLAEAERDLAAIALEETRIKAPFAGQVTDRMVVLGQQVPIAAPCFTLGDFSPLRVRVQLPENVARKVEAGQRVLVSPEAGANELEAVVERVSPVVDPNTSTVRLTLLLDGTDTPAMVGGFVKVRITTDAHHDALSIPKLALVEEGALRSVFVAEADTVRKAEILTGLYDEAHVEILEGLYEGDFVVTMGQGGLRNGSLIKALNAAEVGYAPVESKLDPAKEPETVTALAERD